MLRIEPSLGSGLLPAVGLGSLPLQPSEVQKTSCFFVYLCHTFRVLFSRFIASTLLNHMIAQV